MICGPNYAVYLMHAVRVVQADLCFDLYVKVLSIRFCCSSDFFFLFLPFFVMIKMPEMGPVHEKGLRCGDQKKY